MATKGTKAKEPSVDDVLGVAKAASSTASAAVKVEPGIIKLYHPTYESFVYGPNSEIKFGSHGGFEPHVWIGEQSEMVEQLCAKYPEITVINEVAKVYVCDVCNKEFSSKLGLSGHKRSHN